MGQPITVSAATIDGENAVFDTDRSITGQDGATGRCDLRIRPGCSGCWLDSRRPGRAFV